MTDDIFEALSNEYRRRLLLDLLEHNPQEVSTGPNSDRWIVETRDQAVSVRHTHLPKLADFGFIDWDRDRGVVTKGPRFDEIREVLELLEDHSDDLSTDWC